MAKNQPLSLFKSNCLSPFSWLQEIGTKQEAALEEGAQAVLDSCKQFPDATLAGSLRSRVHASVLREAHAMLDKAVDAAFGMKGFNADADRAAFLFDLKQKCTTLLPGIAKSKRSRKHKAP